MILFWPWTCFDAEGFHEKSQSVIKGYFAPGFGKGEEIVEPEGCCATYPNDYTTSCPCRRKHKVQNAVQTVKCFEIEAGVNRGLKEW